MLMGKTNAGYAVKSMPRYGIDVITAGVCKTNLTRLLGDRSMGKILSVLKSHYDYVICDAPPVLSVADTSALCHYCDGVLLVVRQGHASAKEVRLAKRRLEKLGAEILGVVMNFRSVSKKNERRYYGYYN